MNQTNPQALFPNPHKDILVYQGDVGVKMIVKTDGETVWLTQEQMGDLTAGDYPWAVEKVFTPVAPSPFLYPTFRLLLTRGTLASYVGEYDMVHQNNERRPHG